MAAMYKDLDPLLHSQLRLAIVSILVSVGMANFAFLKKETGATSGNLSIQITRLKEAGYIDVKKKFKGNFPQTTCTITKLGEERFAANVKAISGYLKSR
jgi:DNA-binding transcriptional ArsR family regulator